MRLSTKHGFLIMILIALSSSAGASEWKDFVDIDFDLLSGDAQCSEGFFYFSEENGLEQIRFGHLIDISFDPRKSVTTLTDIGKSSRCRYDSKIKASGRELISETKISQCRDKIRNFTTIDRLMRESDTVLAYEHQQVLYTGKTSRFVCRFQSKSKPKALAHQRAR
jgi:hypothetical protein